LVVVALPTTAPDRLSQLAREKSSTQSPQILDIAALPQERVFLSVAD
jgi:hypothetical protein